MKTEARPPVPEEHLPSSEMPNRDVAKKLNGPCVFFLVMFFCMVIFQIAFALLRREGWLFWPWPDFPSLVPLLITISAGAFLLSLVRYRVKDEQGKRYATILLGVLLALLVLCACGMAYLFDVMKADGTNYYYQSPNGKNQLLVVERRYFSTATSSPHASVTAYRMVGFFLSQARQWPAFL